VTVTHEAFRLGLAEVAHRDPMADVVAGHHQVLALIVPAANDDVGVGMAGVEMIDRHPVEPGVEVALHLGHEVADEWLEVGKPRPLVGRDDEAELVRVLLRAIQEGAAVNVIARGLVEAAGRTFAGDAVPHGPIKSTYHVHIHTARSPGSSRHGRLCRWNRSAGRRQALCLAKFLRLDGRVSAYPGSARGYAVANSHLLTRSDAALLIDTGFGKDEPVIRAQIESLIVPGLPLSMFPLRLNEFMSINNVEAFAGHWPSAL